jgi:hypothetical protein
LMMMIKRQWQNSNIEMQRSLLIAWRLWPYINTCSSCSLRVSFVIFTVVPLDLGTVLIADDKEEQNEKSS